MRSRSGDAHSCNIRLQYQAVVYFIIRNRWCQNPEEGRGAKHLSVIQSIFLVYGAALKHERRKRDILFPSSAAQLPRECALLSSKACLI